MLPLVCSATQLPRLLPRALAGEVVLLPTQHTHEAAAMHPQVPVTEPGAAVIVTTSGSTGNPKGVVLSAKAMLASARATRTHLGGAPMHWYTPLPLHYVAGLMVLVRAHEAGTTPVLLDPHLGDLPAPHPTEKRALSIVPTHLHRALDDPAQVKKLAGFEVVLLGGAPAPAELLDRARTAGIRVVTTYGMSETSGGCIYDGVPLPGVEVGLDEGDGTDGSGRIRITGPMLFEGYRLDPDATAKALVDGRLITHDRGAWTPAGHLRVLGRIDDVVISGGVNVDLAEVQRHLAVVAPAQAAVVVGVPDEEWGTRVVLVTENPDNPASGTPAQPTEDLAHWRDALAASGLGRAALPRQVVRVNRLPRTPSGKIDRQACIRLAAG
ncbi:AMP-binding protein [Propionibacteriaceae bacterium G57]|uniref:AMP-binding protein n=1 Tax=Aestuariimicrobium sp. G57 TaxID=3418485 RepID=UPI003DA72B3B